MSHLTPEELLDLVEGTEAFDPVDREVLTEHLAACAECHRQYEDARAMLVAAAETPVEEPSPLFWNHLSARVRQAVAAQSTPPGSWMDRLGVLVSVSQWRWTASAAGVAVLVVAATVTFNRTADAPVRPSVDAETDYAVMTAHAPGTDVKDVEDVANAADVIAAEQASLTLLADLAGDLSWDDASEAGLMMRRGTVERAISELTAEERIELQRILQAELKKGQGA